MILQLVNEVKQVLKVKAELKDWEQLESQRVAGDGEHQFLIRAMGLPGSTRRNDSILIIIEAIRRNEEFMVNGARERFGLTPREQDVIKPSCKGIDEQSDCRSAKDFGARSQVSCEANYEKNQHDNAIRHSR